MRSKKHFLVLDLGTGSGRAVVYDETGAELGYQASEWQHKFDPNVPGAVDFDTERNWPTLCECIGGALQRAGLKASQIDGVSATGIRLGTVCYDRNGKVLFACTNTDTRADLQTANLIERGLGPKIYEIDGEWPGIGGPSVELLWLRENSPEIFRRIAHVTMLPDWMLYRLSGEYTVDPSGAGTSGMFDGRARTWSAQIAAWLELPTHILAPVHEPGEVIGAVTRQASEETGLPAGLPVIQGGSDAGCGLAGVAVVEPGQAYVGTGSFWNSSIITGQMITDPEARAKILPHVVPGRWQLEGVGFYTGYMMRWFRDAFCEEEKRLARSLGIDVYKILDELAATIPPGSYGVQASAAGIVHSKRWIVPPPAFLGWSFDRPQQSTKAVFYRALLENAAFQMHGTFELLESLTSLEVEEVPLCGGASRSRLWPSILADILGRTIRIPVVKETAALGAAICAAVGTGLYGDLCEASRNMVTWESLHYPTSDERIRQVYREKYEQWLALFAHLIDLVEDGVMKPMWKAAGVRLGRASPAS